MSARDEAGAGPRLHHVNLKTTRLQELIDWYGEVLGTEVTFQLPFGAWITNDGANHRIALFSSDALRDDPDKLYHCGMHHMAFEYDSIDDLLGTFAKLKARGIVPHATLDHGMTTSFYYADPDGNSVELQHDNFGDWQRSKEYMQSSPEFAADPVGTPVDPEKMIEARNAGSSVEEIHRRAFSGEWPPEDYDLRAPL